MISKALAKKCIIRERASTHFIVAPQKKKKRKRECQHYCKKKRKGFFPPTFSPFSHVFECRSCCSAGGADVGGWGRRKTKVGVLQNPGSPETDPSPEPPSATFCSLCKCNRTRHSNGKRSQTKTEQKGRKGKKNVHGGNFLCVFRARFFAVPSR